ncbi:MAG: Rne/Rng family ribonuclease [Paenibacillaceae bacterium]
MKQIVVHCEQDVTKVALLVDGKLVEYYDERPKEERVGSIYKANVVNVLPGMQAAFVDIGQSKNAFLYVDDLLDANLDKVPADKPPIRDLIKEGQEIIVQVAKEPLGTKGAKITTHYTIPGRWIVYMPSADYVGISRKIESQEERQRLKQLGEELRNEGEGLILRTVAEGASLEELERDLKFLRDLWASILAKGKNGKAPLCIYQDLDMVPRIIRDLFTDQIDELIINNVEKKAEIECLVLQYAPHLVERIKLYELPVSMIHYYGIYEAIDKSFRPKVWLSNGGYINIDHTEALTVIDVNTGKYTGSIDLEQTVYETNVEAVEQISRLIRLRDIGGILIIDFIDMIEEEHRQSIVQQMEKLVKQDRTKTIVVGWTQLGLLEMTRKKVRSHGDQLMYESCSYCGGVGKHFILH